MFNQLDLLNDNQSILININLVSMPLSSIKLLWKHLNQLNTCESLSIIDVFEYENIHYIYTLNLPVCLWLIMLAADSDLNKPRLNLQCTIYPLER